MQDINLKRKSEFRPDSPPEKKRKPNESEDQNTEIISIESSPQQSPKYYPDDYRYSPSFSPIYWSGLQNYLHSPEESESDSVITISDETDYWEAKSVISISSDSEIDLVLSIASGD